MHWLTDLFRADFMPHGHCFLWRPEVLSLMVFSDALIGVAYMTIPVTLVHFVRRRRDLNFNWIFYLFASFIVLCGLTHAMAILTIWKPIYRAEAILKLATGLVSIATAILLIRLLPALLRYPSPHDLSEANNRLAKLNDELENAVVQRTIELERARDEALEANRAKSLFLATMSHEIRTPLNGLIGTLALLEDAKPTPAQKELTDIMRLSGDALLTVINDVLDFSKIEAGKLTLDRVAFDLRATVRDALELVRGQARRKGLDLQLDFPAAIPTALIGDPGRLRQILLNLLSNAVKFTANGFVRCQVEALQTIGSRARLRFAVEDSGIGISPEVKAELFRPFTQAESSTTRRFGGTGLGLAICDRLVTLMNGSIHVESAPGQGSRFCFELDFDLDLADRPGEGEEAALDGRRILIVDDVALNRKIIRHYLESNGCVCFEAATAAEALEQLMSQLRGSSPLDAAIIDVEMPIMNGLMLVRAIRAQAQLARFPIVLISSSEHRDLSNRVEDLVDATLLKPTPPSDLRRALAGALLRSARHADAPASVVSAAGRYRVLVAEDNAVNQIVIRRLLENLGYEVIVAHDGQQAFEAARASDFDFILMDCHMPRMDGYEAARAIRAHEATAHARPTPIIAVTANAMSETRDACLAVGMNDYLVKPISQQALAAILAQWRPQP
jgi:signal transduction histidine kinase/DNA-binding response OmpR family regulator